MTHAEIKSIIDEVGQSYLEKYEGLFDSTISNNLNGRYSLKLAGYFVNEPEEISNRRLKVRIYTQNFKAGNQCKEIGITGRFIFDKIQSESLLSENVYLLKSTKDGDDVKREIISKINCPNSYGFRINAPYFATVLNLQDTPDSERRDNLRKFASAYFDWITK